LFTPTAAVFVEAGKSRTLRDSKLAADDATAYTFVVIEHFSSTLSSIYQALIKHF
jgi:hypothetical protein